MSRKAKGSDCVIRHGLATSLIAVAIAVVPLPATADFIRTPAEHCKTQKLEELDREWRPRAEKIKRRIRMSKEDKAQYEKLKRELLDENKYLGLFDAANETVLDVGMLAAGIKTTANLIEDTVTVFAPVKAGGKVVAYRYYKMLKAGQEVQELAEKGVSGYAETAPLKLNPVTNGLKNFAENLETMGTMKGDYQGFMASLRKEVADMDKRLARVQERLDAALAERTEYDKIRAAIIQYCDEVHAAPSPELANLDIEPDEDDEEMDEMVAEKFEDDRDRVMAIEQELQEEIQERQQQTDDADAFFGTLFEAFAAGLAHRYGGSSGGAVNSSSRPTYCAQLRAKIEHDQRWLGSGSGHASVDRAVNAGLNENIRVYNGNCL